MFAKTVFAAIALAPFISSSLAQDCTRNYTVVDGDYCDSISAAQNVSTYQLAALNPSAIDASCSNLQPGTDLCLGTEGQDCTTTYVVKANDTCDGVASAYGLNTTLLYTNNPQLDETDCSNLYIDEVVCVADSTLVPAEPSGTAVATAVPSTATLANAVETGTTSDDDDDDEEDDESQLPWCDEL